MMRLITLVGETARSFHLRQPDIPDFKALIRTVTSGRSMVISTKFRSDLFFRAEVEKGEAILRMWALHAKTDYSKLHQAEMSTAIGDEPVLRSYFESMNRLAANWSQYRLYQRAFSKSFENDPDNPLAVVVAQCDHYLTNRPEIKRPPLTKTVHVPDPRVSKDTFALAMKLLNNEAHEN